MKILHDLVLVNPIKENDTTSSGIILPKHKYPIGKVVKLGIKVKKLKVGDTVMYYNDVGSEINYRGDNLLFLSESSEIISTI